MCTELHVVDGNHWINQAHELAALVGRENILWCYGEDDTPVAGPEYMASYALKFCLCPIAIEATMERAGYVVESGWENHSCDYVARLPNKGVQ